MAPGKGEKTMEKRASMARREKPGHAAACSRAALGKGPRVTGEALRHSLCGDAAWDGSCSGVKASGKAW
jgi:hypothetical protein